MHPIKPGKILFLAITATALFATPNAKTLTQQKCGVCHAVTNITMEQVKHLVAPPMWGVVRHLKRQISDEKRFKSFVADYVMHPSKEKILFNKEAMERFGLMPSQKGALTKEELATITDYLWKTY